MYFPEDEHIARAMHNEMNSCQMAIKENINPTDNKLELIDPTPSIHDLFVSFNKKFFWGKLGMVQVLWSNKMTTCAGLCYFEGMHGLCKISLSAPLLVLRPRKDLVETLLHEMIHAYLFVTNNTKDRTDHGPEFHKHMFRINKEAGTNITVYHTFHDEVEHYKRHIWRCTGTCRTKKPYFGFVRRAVNRAPGPSDPWWSQHKRECNGVFVKIAGPDKPKKPAAKSNKKSVDIRDLLKCEKTVPKVNKSNVVTISDIKYSHDGDKEKESNFKSVSHQLNTVQRIITPKASQFEAGKFKKINNIQGSTLNSNNLVQTNKALGSDPNQNFEKKSNDELSGAKVRDVVRQIWSAKFANNENGTAPAKKIKLTDDVNKPSTSVQQDCSQEENGDECESNTGEDTKTDSDVNSKLQNCPVCNEEIFSSKLEEHLERCVSYSFTMDEGNQFIENEIICDSVPCPCCLKWYSESSINSHIDECLNLIAIKEEFLKSQKVT